MDSDPPAMSGFDLLLGTEFLSNDPEAAQARLEVRDEHMRPQGVVHGGVLSSLVESVCSYSTWVNVRDRGVAATGQTLDISFLRPVTEGTLTVNARVRHRGRSSWVWEAEATDAEGRLCALAKRTVAVRPAERPA